MALRSILWSRAARAAALAALALAGPRCGARTGLVDPCSNQGAHRPCANSCGSGDQLCTFGDWQPCVVPPTTRACSNTCGGGEQHCVDDAWLACDIPVTTRSCSSVCGPGTETCTDDTWGPCDAPMPGLPTLVTTVRDFQVGQLPDFFPTCCFGHGVDPGIVAATLGPDGTPAYAGNPVSGTLTTHGAADFYDWWHDVPGVNLSTSVPLRFLPEATMPGSNMYYNHSFFPIDGQLYGDQGEAHNEFFTLQAHAQILYTGGETYGFTSDDDLWVFINHHLIVDLGGLHLGLDANVDLDAIATDAGITVGNAYPLDLFYANRQPPGAVLVISIPAPDLMGCP